MNIELFRLCIESQRTGVNLEQNLTAYVFKKREKKLQTLKGISKIDIKQNYNPI